MPQKGLRHLAQGCRVREVTLGNRPTNLQPQIARAQVTQQIRQRRLAALKGQDGPVQVIQGNGDFHCLIGGRP